MLFVETFFELSGLSDKMQFLIFLYFRKKIFVFVKFLEFLKFFKKKINSWANSSKEIIHECILHAKLRNLLWKLCDFERKMNEYMKMFEKILRFSMKHYWNLTFIINFCANIYETFSSSSRIYTPQKITQLSKAYFPIS